MHKRIANQFWISSSETETFSVNLQAINMNKLNRQISHMKPSMSAATSVRN